MKNARKICLDALLRVEKDKAYSNIVLGSFLSKNDFNKNDKAFISALFYGVLDRKITLDFYIKKLSNIPFKKIEPITKMVLRMGLFQICFMEKVPQNAAVNESVNLLKNTSEERNCSFVNAILRNTASLPPLPVTKDLYSLSVRYSCPTWIISELIKDYSAEETEKILETFLLPGEINLRTNTLKITTENLCGRLEEMGIKCIDVKENNIKVKGGIDFKNNLLFLEGLFHIQDTSSQNCAASLQLQQGMRMLDLCAAPGGKSFTSALIMENKGEIISCDLYENRVELIKKGAERLGIHIINPIVNDATIFNESLGLFDRVLCDVPCSGLGVIRRKPDIKYKSGEDFSLLKSIQKKILSTAVRYLKNDGKLLYSTCTLRKAENEEIVNDFLSENKDFCAEYMYTDIPSKDNDGFFRAIIYRK